VRLAVKFLRSNKPYLITSTSSTTTTPSSVRAAVATTVWKRTILGRRGTARERMERKNWESLGKGRACPSTRKISPPHFSAAFAHSSLGVPRSWLNMCRTGRRKIPRIPWSSFCQRKKRKAPWIPFNSLRNQ
ncbi:Zinc finger protein 420like, partial [Caligus rogercresseyi]